jgi:hypothetical protein
VNDEKIAAHESLKVVGNTAAPLAQASASPSAKYKANTVPTGSYDSTSRRDL